MTVEIDRRFWIAHARGPNFSKLREKGFTVFFPTMDDYVFLEVKPGNEQFHKKQLELGIAFLREGGKYVTIDFAQILRMTTATLARIDEGTEILVVDGHASGLEGKVLESIEGGQKLRVLLEGFNRKYEVTLDRLEVVEKGKAKVLSSDGQAADSGREPSDLLGL